MHPFFKWLLTLLAFGAGFGLIGLPAADWWLGVDTYGRARLETAWVRELVVYLLPMVVGLASAIPVWNKLEQIGKRSGNLPPRRS